jgi:hypothetical protein
MRLKQATVEKPTNSYPSGNPQIPSPLSKIPHCGGQIEDALQRAAGSFNIEYRTRNFEQQKFLKK